MKFKFLEHTADIKFQAFGKTLGEAFENSALALASVMYNPEKIKPELEKKIEISGIDEKSLLYNFLEEFIFLMDSEDFLLNKIEKIEIKENKLSAVALGDNKTDKYEIKGDVKAATYAEMEIKKEKDKVVVQVVLDI